MTAAALDQIRAAGSAVRNTVTVELVPPDRQIGALRGVARVVVERDGADGQWVHLPETPDERAMTLVEYGQKVAAADEGATWVEPQPWVFDDGMPEPDGKQIRNPHLSRLPVLHVRFGGAA